MAALLSYGFTASKRPKNEGSCEETDGGQERVRKLKTTEEEARRQTSPPLAKVPEVPLSALIENVREENGSRIEEREAVKNVAGRRTSTAPPENPESQARIRAVPESSQSSAMPLRKSRPGRISSSRSSKAFTSLGAKAQSPSSLNKPPPRPARSPKHVQLHDSAMFSATVFPATQDRALCAQAMGPPAHTSSERLQHVLGTNKGGLSLDTKFLNPAARSKSRRTARLSSSGGSIAATPVSAYARHALSQRTGALSQPNVIPPQTLPPWDQSLPLTPIEMDLAALEVIANMPVTAHPSRTNTIVPGSRRNRGLPPGRKRSVYSTSSGASVTAVELPGGSVAVELPGGEVVTVISPEESAWQRAKYISGPIRLESRLARAVTQRNLLDIIQENVDAELGRSGGKRAAELAIADDVVDFFDSFGPGYQATGCVFDAFWMDAAAKKKMKIRPERLQLNNQQRPARPSSNGSTLVPPSLTSPYRADPRDRSVYDMNIAEEVLDQFGENHAREIVAPWTSFDIPAVNPDDKRASYTSSFYADISSAGTLSSKTNHSPPLPKSPFAVSSPLGSPDLGNMSGGPGSRAGKAKQAKEGGKMSLRGWIKAAGSIV